jgi:hypothetical protein
MKRGEISGLGSISGEISGWSLGMIGGSHLSAGERKRSVPVQQMNRWAAGLFWYWAESLPEGLFFFFLSSFSFSVFLFLSYLFQIWSKLIQTSL